MTDQRIFVPGQKVIWWNGDKNVPAEVVVVTATHCMIKAGHRGLNTFVKQADLIDANATWRELEDD